MQQKKKERNTHVKKPYRGTITLIADAASVNDKPLYFNTLSLSSDWHRKCTSWVKQFMIKRAVLILAFWLITPHIWCQSLELTERESLEKAYVEGKDTFYATLQKKATHAQLENADRKKLLDARKIISGLYEHLMNFYYFTKPDEQGEENIQPEWQGNLWILFPPEDGKKTTPHSKPS